MPVTKVKITTMTAQALAAVFGWQSDTNAAALSQLAIARNLEDLKTAPEFTLAADQVLPASVFTATGPTAPLALLAESFYYCQAQCDGVYSPVRAFVTYPNRVPPSPILLRMFAKPVTISRFPIGVYDKTNGKYVQDPAITFPATCSIQPLNLREMLMMPEGERTKQPVRVYSDIRLLEASQQSGQKGDRFDYNGRQYEVQQSGTWNMPGRTRINYFKSVAVTVEQDS